MSTTVGSWLADNEDLDRLDREVLLMDALSVSRARILTSPEQHISTGQSCRINAQAAALRAGKPLAYVRGFKEFWGLTLVVDEHVLVPRPETEHLVEHALALIQPGDRVADLGTGSGAVAIAIASERPDVAVWASDVSEAALTIAKRNAAAHEAEIHLVRSFWLDDLPGAFDVIISNPPYVAEHDSALEALQYEPRSALVSGTDGLNDIREIVAQARTRCTRALLIEHGADQGGAVRALFLEAGFENVATHPDLAGHDRVTLGLRHER